MQKKKEQDGEDKGGTTLGRFFKKKKIEIVMIQTWRCSLVSSSLQAFWIRD